jgi:hypothetical protein
MRPREACLHGGNLTVLAALFLIGLGGCGTGAAAAVDGAPGDGRVGGDREVGDMDRQTVRIFQRGSHLAVTMVLVFEEVLDEIQD